MFTVREDRTQFDVMIPPQHRAAFGDEIATRYEFRGLCVTPRAVQDRKAVVHAPRELEITAEPARTLLPLPTGVYRPCQADINTALIFSVASLLSSCSSPTPPDAIPGLNGLVLDAESNTRIAGATVQAAGKSTVSDENGLYSFGSLSYTSSITLTARKEGYRDFSETRTLDPEQGVFGAFWNIQLRRL